MRYINPRLTLTLTLLCNGWLKTKFLKNVLKMFSPLVSNSLHVIDILKKRNTGDHLMHHVKCCAKFTPV